jgi:two-component system, NarL family, nitrate/nitrite response regulator NarL
MWSELLAATLRQDARFSASVGNASDSGFVEQVLADRPDVVLVGIEGDLTSGVAFDVLRAAHAAAPDLKSVMLLETGTGPAIRDAFRAGARGVVNRGDSAEVLMECLCNVFQGRVWARTDHFSSFLDLLGQYSVNRRPASEPSPEALTKREIDLVECVSKGMTNREIAAKLQLSEHTVRNYLFRVFRKFGVSNRAELVSSALQPGRKPDAVHPSLES